MMTRNSKTSESVYSEHDLTKFYLFSIYYSDIDLNLAIENICLSLWCPEQASYYDHVINRH